MSLTSSEQEESLLLACNLFHIIELLSQVCSELQLLLTCLQMSLLLVCLLLNPNGDNLHQIHTSFMTCRLMQNCWVPYCLVKHILILVYFSLFLILWCQHSVNGHTLFYRQCVLCLHWELMFHDFCYNCEVFGTIVHFLCRQVIFHSVTSLYFHFPRAEMCSWWPSVMVIVLPLALRIVILLLPWHMHTHSWFIHVSYIRGSGNSKRQFIGIYCIHFISVATLISNFAFF